MGGGTTLTRPLSISFRRAAGLTPGQRLQTQGTLECRGAIPDATMHSSWLAKGLHSWLYLGQDPGGHTSQKLVLMLMYLSFKAGLPAPSAQSHLTPGDLSHCQHT